MLAAPERCSTAPVRHHRRRDRTEEATQPSTETVRLLTASASQTLALVVGSIAYAPLQGSSATTRLCVMQAAQIAMSTPPVCNAANRGGSHAGGIEYGYHVRWKHLDTGERRSAGRKRW
ncbi:hypothetical protein LO763_19730 [Glycomyces sp. A-F 0318]|uniref:hypothetical protein n=1 Tax=Glycomyces amatae TaxID=2881355 RepID=UPI001E2CA167|nr:hypothetical protein [Glycomyces amatae]MCD0445843.1 hypothetical protein [Glycomyces amatae]